MMRSRQIYYMFYMGITSHKYHFSIFYRGCKQANFSTFSLFEAAKIIKKSVYGWYF